MSIMKYVSYMPITTSSSRAGTRHGHPQDPTDATVCPRAPPFPRLPKQSMAPCRPPLRGRQRPAGSERACGAVTRSHHCCHSQPLGSSVSDCQQGIAGLPNRGVSTTLLCSLLCCPANGRVGVRVGFMSPPGLMPPGWFGLGL